MRWWNSILLLELYALILPLYLYALMKHTTKSISNTMMLSSICRSDVLQKFILLPFEIESRTQLSATLWKCYPPGNLRKTKRRNISAKKLAFQCSYNHSKLADAGFHIFSWFLSFFSNFLTDVWENVKEGLMHFSAYRSCSFKKKSQRRCTKFLGRSFTVCPQILQFQKNSHRCYRRSMNSRVYRSSHRCVQNV